MATRQAEAIKLVGRVKRVGWPVEQTDGGVWMVKCPPTGKTVQIHQTGNSNAHVAKERELNDNGFAEAEQAFNEKKEADRQAKLKADKVKEARQIKLAEGRARILSAAAGPYGQSQVTIDEILADHPAPLTYHRVLVTPDMAKAILERNLPTEAAPWPNRPIYAVDVAVWEGVLRTGRWRYTHQGVAIDWDGRLQDGQNRLTAIAQSGIAAEMMISVGMDPENFAVVDAGRKRTAAQVLRMAGVKDSNPVSSAVRLIYLFEVWGAAMLDHDRQRVTSDLIKEVALKLDVDDLEWSVAWAYRLRREIRTAISAPAAAMYLLRRKLPVDDPRLDQFAALLVEGVVGEDREASPIYQLRRQMSRQSQKMARRLTPSELMALIIKGWNAYAQGRVGGSMLVVRRDAPMPSIFLPPPIETVDAVDETDQVDELVDA